MRSVPHRVVCLLGLDDAAFPRKAPRDGDDIMLADPHVGDRDPRPEDRQMLLDALMAASDRLIVTYSGNDVRTNTPRPPAVPVGELLDVIARTVQGDVREQVLVRHPLQPFDPRNFKPGELGGAPPWSFNRVTLDGARAMQDERAEPLPFLTGPLPPEPSPVVELEDLVAFVRHPVRAFLRQRLGFSVATYADEVDDALPIDLDNLESWQIGQRMLDARLAGATEEAALGGGARPRRAPARQPRRAGRRQAPARGRADRRGRRGPAPGRNRSGFGRRARDAPRRTAAQRHGPRRLRHAAAERHLLAREPAAPVDDLGALPRFDRRAP